jgi:hypothetical protein
MIHATGSIDPAAFLVPAWFCGIGEQRHSSSSTRARVANSINKVSRCRKIDNENQDFDRTGMAVYLINLNWNEGAGDDYGEPLSPTSHHPETDALG